ncbi:hypothetical protein DFP73DRAFT_211540 [Morchella snyderi]|nr:hypothetical protein DFP73DRAFT_211540 [Morchella snyderi]
MSIGCSSLMSGNSNVLYIYSTGYSPHNDTSGQPSKNHSTPTEATVSSPNTSTPVAHYVLSTPVHLEDAVADHTFSEAQPVDTQTRNVSTSWGATPDQPCKHPLTPIESSMAASDTFTTPTANQPAIRTTSIPDIVTSSTISESHEAQTKKASPLWEEAFRKMREQNEGRQGDDEMPPKGSLVDNIIKDLKERKEQCDDKRWFIIKDDRKVFIVDTLLLQLDKYAAIGDIALQHNPDIVALVWAGFRGLLQVGTAYIKMMRSVSESLDYLVQLLCCCDIYEKLYCNTKFDISEDLNGCFVDLYVSILKYLRKTSIYLDQDTGGRIIRSFSQEMESSLSGIKSQQMDLKEKIDVAEKEASTSNRLNQDKNMTRLRRLLAGIQEPIKETLRVVEIIFNKVENDRRYQILTWLSDVEYESHHMLSQQRRLKGTGSWLLENKPYIEWTASEASSILWLRADAGFGKTILAL